VASFQVTGGFFHFRRDVTQQQLNQFGRCFVAGEVLSIFEHVTQLHVQTLDGVGGVNDFSDLGQIDKKRNDLFPDSSPALDESR
jgi:hypothetical protein